MVNTINKLDNNMEISVLKMTKKKWIIIHLVQKAKSI